MINSSLSRFQTIWCVDFEFQNLPGENPMPICLVAHEIRSNNHIKVWQDRLQALSSPPYAIGNDSLIVSYYSSAEMLCHLALGWEFPRHVLDLFAEFRVLTNGRRIPCGDNLLGALTYFGIDGISVVEKTAMRALVACGGPWSSEER